MLVMTESRQSRNPPRSILTTETRKTQKRIFCAFCASVAKKGGWELYTTTQIVAIEGKVDLRFIAFTTEMYSICFNFRHHNSSSA